MGNESPAESDLPPAPRTQLATLVSDDGRSMIVAGTFVAVLGLVAIIFPQMTSITIGLLFGVALLAAGIVSIAHAVLARDWTGSVGELLLAVVFVIAGSFMLANPILTLTTLTMLLVAYLFLEGVALFYLAWTLRGEQNWVWSGIAGLTSFVLAGLVWTGFPSSADWVIGLLFGVNLLATGGSMILVGRDIKRATETISPSMAQPGTGN